MNFFEEYKDKIHHVVYSFAICMAVCCIFSFLTIAPVIGFIVALAAGVFKEIKDTQDPYGNAEFSDLVANMLGIVIALGMFLFSRMF